MVQSGYLTYPSIESLLENQSIKRELPLLGEIGKADIGLEGQLYDQTGEDVLPHIQSFISTYQLPLDELLVSDLTKYPVSRFSFSYGDHH